MFEHMRFPAGASLTAEMVTDGHPDKFCDQVADAILDRALAQDPNSRVALECLAKDNLLLVSGEMTTEATVSVEDIAKNIWHNRIGYGPAEELAVINHIRKQSPDIARGRGIAEDGGVDLGGAGDQGIMIGYATDETTEMMPLEYICARRICERLRELRQSKTLPWLKVDGKSQVTVKNGMVTSVVIAAHHDPEIGIDEVREILKRQVVEPLFGSVPRMVINGTGAFTIGGPRADAGVVGRKVVVDAYGPRVPVGGGAYSGKDPSKVDRTAAYMARHIAKTVVAHKIGGARKCLVALAFGIGQKQPEMVTAITEKGRLVTHWVKTHFRDLSPESMINYLELRHPKNWTYLETASFGHYGRHGFPWERVAEI
jgi:S-adenosylmethionine synthetase